MHLEFTWKIQSSRDKSDVIPDINTLCGLAPTHQLLLEVQTPTFHALQSTNAFCRTYLINLISLQISPVEIENEVKRIQGVLDSVVTGVKVGDLDMPIAVVVRRNGSAISEKQIVEYIKSKYETFRPQNNSTELRLALKLELVMRYRI